MMAVAVLVLVVLMAMMVVMFVVMVMFMVVAVSGGMDQATVALLLTVDHHTHVGAGDTLAADALRLHRETGDQAVHGVQELLLLRVQLVESAHEHIPCRPHGALQVQGFHASSTPFIWLIREARKPAPKPLSMFTTLIPLAQEFSMAKRAASPPRLAP